jgi:hypothetical protein
MPLKFLAIGILLAIPLVAEAQIPANPDPKQPDFSMIVQGTFDAQTLAEFNRRIQDYDALRRRLEVGLPPLVVTTNADEIETFEHARADAATIAVIMDDGPGDVDIDVNDTYAKKHSLATMPPNLLLLLPDLPKDIEYRFVGRHLVLRDARANIVIDEIPHAIRCNDCVVEPEHEEENNDDPKRPR